MSTDITGESEGNRGGTQKWTRGGTPKVAPAILVLRGCSGGPEAVFRMPSSDATQVLELRPTGASPHGLVVRLLAFRAVVAALDHLPGVVNVRDIPGLSH